MTNIKKYSCFVSIITELINIFVLNLQENLDQLQVNNSFFFICVLATRTFWFVYCNLNFSDSAGNNLIGKNNLTRTSVKIVYVFNSVWSYYRTQFYISQHIRRPGRQRVFCGGLNVLSCVIIKIKKIKTIINTKYQPIFKTVWKLVNKDTDIISLPNDICEIKRELLTCTDIFYFYFFLLVIINQ